MANVSDIKETIEGPVVEAINTCIRIQCHYCARGVAVLEYPNDENLYHHDVSPCHARRIRRHFAMLGNVNVS